jgi:hypothetical protein
VAAGNCAGHRDNCRVNDFENRLLGCPGLGCDDFDQIGFVQETLHPGWTYGNPMLWAWRFLLKKRIKTHRFKITQRPGSVRDRSSSVRRFVAIDVRTWIEAIAESATAQAAMIKERKKALNGFPLIFIKRLKKD